MSSSCFFLKSINPKENLFKISAKSSNLSLKNLTAFATPRTAVAKPWTAFVKINPIAFAIASKSF